MENSRNCPICGKDVVGFLKHIRFSHKISNEKQFQTEIEKIQKKKKLQIEFSKLVEDLQNRKKLGEITSEEYRQLITKWVQSIK